MTQKKIVKKFSLNPTDLRKHKNKKLTLVPAAGKNLIIDDFRSIV